jgi:hypothetical protein
MAKDRRAAAPRGAMRGDQRDRIDLEPMPGLRRNIGAWARRDHPVPFAQQQPAYLGTPRRGGRGANEVQHIA